VVESADVTVAVECVDDSADGVGVVVCDDDESGMKENFLIRAAAILGFVNNPLDDTVFVEAVLATDPSVDCLPQLVAGAGILLSSLASFL
jgi:hypothetical protein